MTRRRKAFTVIEILVVIGIIVILAGILVYGVNSVMITSKVNATRTTLQVLRSMVSEFEVATKGLNRQPAYMWATDGTNGQWTPAANPGMDIWRDGELDGAASATNPEPDAAMADKGDVNRAAGNLRYEQPMIGNTQLVMGLLLQAPGNKKLMDQMSPSQLMEELPAGLPGAPQTKITIKSTATNGPPNVPYASAAANRNPSPPLVLDGWGNPIIFVPGGGLYDVYTGGVRRNPVKDPPPGSNPGPIRSPDGRPFWASAGPDGHFGGYRDRNDNGTFDPDVDTAYGDDNIYSFGN